MKKSGIQIPIQIPTKPINILSQNSAPTKVEVIIRNTAPTRNSYSSRTFFNPLKAPKELSTSIPKPPATSNDLNDTFNLSNPDSVHVEPDIDDVTDVKAETNLVNEKADLPDFSGLNFSSDDSDLSGDENNISPRF